MESLLILFAIVIIDALIKRAKAKKTQSPPWHAPQSDSTQEIEEDYENEDDDESIDEEQETQPTPSPSRKLQEYIRQFEEAQREASQGTLEPAMPPPIPESTHKRHNNVAMQEVAETIIALDVVNAQFLMEEFRISKESAIEMLEKLQQHRIIGRDMGDGEHDVLIHDTSELFNLLSREQKEVQEDSLQNKNISSTENLSKNIPLKNFEVLDNNPTREEAATEVRQGDSKNSYTSATELTNPLQKRTTARSISRESVRRGFVWAKIIDEPRFKKHWTSISR